jgi:hypothetical protein
LKSYVEKGLVAATGKREEEEETPASCGNAAANMEFPLCSAFKCHTSNNQVNDDYTLNRTTRRVELGAAHSIIPRRGSVLESGSFIYPISRFLMQRMLESNTEKRLLI